MSSVFTEGLLHWQMLFALVINGLITLITIVNVLYLHNAFSHLSLNKPKSILTFDDSKRMKSHISPNKHLISHQTIETESVTSIISSIISLSPNTPKTSKRITAPKSIKPHETFNKNRVITYFKITPWTPLFIAYISFYGAIFPENAIWIIPFQNIVIGLYFLMYIKMLIISCDGWFIIQHYLEPEKDRCCLRKNSHKMRINHRHSMKSPQRHNNKVKCCIRSNAYLGLRCKIKICYIILLKPILNYITAYFQYYYNMIFISYVLKILSVFTTIIPIMLVLYIHDLLKPYSKISNTNIKLMVVIFLSPICQLQQALISFLFDMEVIPKSNGFINSDLELKYDWPCLYGIIICVEMLMVCIIIIWKVFPADDLVLWDKLDALMRERGNSEVSMNVGVTVMDSDTES